MKALHTCCSKKVRVDSHSEAPPPLHEAPNVAAKPTTRAAPASFRAPERKSDERRRRWSMGDSSVLGFCQRLLKRRKRYPILDNMRPLHLQPSSRCLSPISELHSLSKHTRSTYGLFPVVFVAVRAS